MFKQYVTDQDKNVILNLQNNRMKAKELANELCTIFNLDYEFKDDFILLKDKHNKQFRIYFENQLVFKDASNTGIGSYQYIKLNMILPEKLRLKTRISGTLEYCADEQYQREEWSNNWFNLTGVNSSFSGNCGYGPYIHLSIPVNEEYSKLVFDLIKFKGIEFRS